VTAELTARRSARLTAAVVGTVVLGFFSVNIGLQEVTNAGGLDAQHWTALMACVTGLAAIVALQPYVVLRLVRRGHDRATLPEPVP
jgi:lipopolysaccharide export LptBFGC system permease protein LptF